MFTFPLTQVFPKDSPLVADFSQVILQLAENGALNNLEKKWFSVALSSSPTPDNERKKESLSLDSFWALFLFTGCTSTIILLVFSAHSFLPTRARAAAAVSFEPLRQSFKKVWTATAKLNEKRESLKPSEQQGSGMNSPWGWRQLCRTPCTQWHWWQLQTMMYQYEKSEVQKKL